MFDELHHWLILGSDLANVLRLIEDRAFGLSTDFAITVTSDGRYHNLYDAYNTFKERGEILNVTFLGNWSKSSRLSVSLTQTKFRRRSNLRRLVLSAMFFKCAYKPNGMPLETYLEDYAQATKDGRSKFGFQILNHLSDMYNFTFQFSESTTWERGDAIGPVARAVMNNSVDFAGSPLSMTSQRTHLLKYVHQDWPFRTCFIFRNPQPTTIKVQEIVRPLANDTWYLMALLITVSVTILTMILRFEETDSKIIRFSNSLLINIGSLCQQGTDLKMERISTRIVFLFIMIFSLLMYNYYSASVVSARLDEPIFKINDSLLVFGALNLKMSSERMVYLEFFFKNPDWETQVFFKKYWVKIPTANRFMEPQVGIQLVKEGGFAYHTHPDISYEYIDRSFDNREICELTEVHLARLSSTAFAVTRNSSFVELARVGLTKITEVGLRSRQLLRWQYRKPRCRKDVLTASSINIYEFAPHMLLLMIGMLLAIVVYVIEIIVADREINFRFKITSKAKNIV